MTRQDENLERLDSWDFDSAEARPPVKGRRAIVSVAFLADDFRKVAQSARARGQKLSEFIRNAALERCLDDKPVLETVLTTAGYMAIYYQSRPEPTTRLSSEIKQATLA